ncbi:Hypothetical protein TPAS_1978 [Trichococcus pasteurii]|uniref:Lipoprotein n=1 Tax=Trichococcus pasteurii TaxID=43064 RepID=A0A1W1IH23_9LACT|nr:hypothetical protein SAMN04488086_11445 [Trichococcus pasteurii]SLM52284.1 Hypothetical protein TPAS_1978 [Trichococcus pasteurii]SSB93165.1 Hypothetical protein TPAS_1978 [Trichococcus pasteurii]
MKKVFLACISTVMLAACSSNEILEGYHLTPERKIVLWEISCWYQMVLQFICNLLFNFMELKH